MFASLTRRGVALALVAAAPIASVRASDCAFEPQGEGHVIDVTDARSFRFADGREIKLAGIELVASDASKALSAIIANKDITLRGEDDAPDRYGRQSAFVFLAGSETPVQSLLLKEGAALVSSEITEKACAAALLSAEAEARREQKGAWAGASVIKNAESTDDILAGIGRFMLVEGTVLTVRQAGATTYLNFGRRWTRDFAVTVSRRNMPAVESAGMTLKSLENRRIRVRGWVEAHPGPRIEVMRAGQIEILSGN